MLLELNQGRRRLFLAVLLLPLQFIQGCRSMHPVENVHDYNSVIRQVQVHDVVRITTKNGDVYKTRVVSITEDRIIGKNIEIALSDISQIEVRKTDQEKKGAIKASVIFGATAVLIFILLILTHHIEIN